MPIYEYQCKACSQHVEAFQKVSDDPLKKCPECGQDELTKLISAASFHLKGSGWYVTDFRDKDKNQPAKASDKTDSKPESNANESKPKADKPKKEEKS